MEAEGGVEDGTHSNGDRSSVATVNDSSMSTVVPASSSAALSSEEGAQMEDINYNNSEVDEGEGKDAVSHDAAGGGSSLSPELIQTLLSQLPHALNLLTQLNANLQSAKTPPFHALRKEVLRLAAQLQKVRETNKICDTPTDIT